MYIAVAAFVKLNQNSKSVNETNIEQKRDNWKI